MELDSKIGNVILSKILQMGKTKLEYSHEDIRVTKEFCHILKINQAQKCKKTLNLKFIISNYFSVLN